MNLMNVCYATSDEFTIHTGISLLSLLDNNQGVIGRAFVLDYGMTEESKGKLKNICDSYMVECCFIRAKEKLMEIGEKTGIKNFRDSYATYSRAFLDLLLPEDVDEVLYIDSDTVVIGSVAPIREVDMTEKVLCGCAVGSFHGKRKDGKDRQPELNNLLTKNHFYIQCGVLWYSLKHWREYHCTDMIMQTTCVLDHYTFADQTLINNSLPDRFFVKMPLKYNLSRHNHCDKYNLLAYRCGAFYTDEQILDALHSPVIIHYCGSPLARPWYDVCVSRRTQHYRYYKERSAWRDVPLQCTARPKTFRERMKQHMTVWGMKTDNYTWGCILSKIRRIFFG